MPIKVFSTVAMDKMDCTEPDEAEWEKFRRVVQFMHDDYPEENQKLINRIRES